MVEISHNQTIGQQERQQNRSHLWKTYPHGEIYPQAGAEVTPPHTAKNQKDPIHDSPTVHLRVAITVHTTHTAVLRLSLLPYTGDLLTVHDTIMAREVSRRWRARIDNAHAQHVSGIQTIGHRSAHMRKRACMGKRSKVTITANTT